MIAKQPTRRTRIGKRNQVTLPAEMLRVLGLRPGEAVTLSLREGTAIEVAKAADPVAHAFGLLHRPGQKTLSEEELNEAIREAASTAATERYLRSLRQ